MAKHRSTLPAASNDNPRPLIPKPIEPAIDLEQVKKLQLFISVFGETPPSKTRLNIVFGDMTNTPYKVLGALWLTARQWEQLKRYGDRILEANRKARSRQALKE